VKKNYMYNGTVCIVHALEPHSNHVFI